MTVLQVTSEARRVDHLSPLKSLCCLSRSFRESSLMGCAHLGITVHQSLPPTKLPSWFVVNKSTLTPCGNYRAPSYGAAECQVFLYAFRPV